MRSGNGQWLPASLIYTTGPTHPQLGQPLTIRFWTYGFTDPPGQPGLYQVSIDNVRLTATPVPELECSGSRCRRGDGAVVRRSASPRRDGEAPRRARRAWAPHTAQAVASEPCETRLRPSVKMAHINLKNQLNDLRAELAKLYETRSTRFVLTSSPRRLRSEGRKSTNRVIGPGLTQQGGCFCGYRTTRDCVI